jgi:hypothetical protein
MNRNENIVLASDVRRRLRNGALEKTACTLRIKRDSLSVFSPKNLPHHLCGSERRAAVTRCAKLIRTTSPTLT